MGTLSSEHAELVEAIAVRVVELLEHRGSRDGRACLVSAVELATALGVARSFVYEHADELGAVRLGGGSKPRLRFDLERARAAFACYSSERSQALEDVSVSNGDGQSLSGRSRPTHHRGGRLPNGVPKPGSVLAVRGLGRGGNHAAE